MHEPWYGLAVLIGAAVGTPCGACIIAMHDLVTSNSPIAVQVVAVFVFVIINFSLVIIPFAFYLARPKRTEEAIKRFKV